MTTATSSATIPTLSRRQLNRATLARQSLLVRGHDGPVAAIERLYGMQAQDPAPPFAGLWTRLDAFQRSSLHRALHERTVVRGTLMRGTLHLMSAADYLALRPTLQPMLDRFLLSLPSRERSEKTEIIDRAREILRGQPLTFRDLRAALLSAFPGRDDRALGMIVRMGLPLIMIPTDDRWAFPGDSRFGLADEWLADPLAPPGSAEMLIRRYLAAFGPANAADIQQWSGLAGLAHVLETLRSQLTVFQDERGQILLDLPEAPRPAPDTPAPLRFLPAFDNLLLSHRVRSRILSDAHRRIVFAAKNGRIPGTFLVDGFVAGMWRVDQTKNEASLTLTPFAPLAASAVAPLTEEGDAMLRFLAADAARYEVHWQHSDTG